MKPITHKQAIQWIHRRQDGLLNEDQLLSLEEHLWSCDTCRAYAINMDGLSAHLQNEFHRHWDTQPGPSQNVYEYVTTRARAIPMANRISSGAKLLAGAMALIVLGIAINFVVSQLQSTSPVTSATETVDNSAFATDRLLAFTSDQNGNSEIYTIHADGSGRTNLTNNPAYDGTPFWSPDGRRIAFTSDREGSTQIYIMDADGSNVTRLTNGEGNYAVDPNGYSPWSPDGSKLIISHISAASRASKSYILVLNVTDKTITPLTDEANQYTLTSWSPDGKHIAFTSDPGGTPRDLFIVGSDGKGLTKLTENLHFMFEYDWSQDGASLFFATHRNQQVYQKATYISTVYKASMDGSIEVAATTTDGQIIDWWNDMDVRLELSETLLIWTRSDGSQSALKLCENSGQMAGIAHKRSKAGNWMFGSNCSPNGWMLYWANPDGTTVHPLLESPVAVDDDVLFKITWSSDDQHIAFVSLNSLSTDVTETLYVLDVAKAREDPSVQPLNIMNASSPSWQPISNREVVEEKPTPAPVETLSSNGLVAFVSEGNGNLEIYTMRADGSEVINITNSPATDRNPFWSPDGTRIAFESDRTGIVQIFVMNADGSSVFQVTDGETDHTFENLNPWSPDGSRLLIIEKTPDNDKRLLYTIGTDGQNKTRLTNVPNVYSAPSWSPNGQHVAYIIVEPVGDRDMARIHVVDANGNGDTNVTNILPADEDLYSWNYSWTREGNISFIAGRVSWENNNGKFAYYEATIDGATLAEIAKTSTALEDYWDGTMFVRGFGDTLTWLRADGTYSEFKPYENCQKGDETQSPGSYSKRSSNGYLLFTAGCPNGDLWLYWSDPKGTTTKPLFESPIPIAEGGLNEIYWSPDGGYAALTISSAGETSLYIVDIREALKAPIALPESTVLGRNDIAYSIAWQPISNRDVVEEKPTPEPTQAAESEKLPSIGTNISNGEWIAFIASSEEIQSPDDINADVFFIRPDGSGLFNLTQFPAHYSWLQWSPDGQHLLFLRQNSDSNKVDILRSDAGDTGYEVVVSAVREHQGPFEYRWSPNSQQIAFLDNHTGNYDIYTIHADGRNDPQLRQLTSDPAQDVGFVWSPDGNQIAFQRLNGDQLSVYVMNEDGSNQREVSRGMGKVRLQWSMDGQSLYANSIYLWADTKYSLLECEGCVARPAIYRIDLDEPSTQQIYYEEDASKFIAWIYDTPANTLYFMSMEERTASVGVWGTWMYWDGNSVHEIGQMDPRQTCKTTAGNILSENISPNKGFSVISNYCAGGFDLYLADRETSDPEKKLDHLLRLPLDTYGQGGDGATIPMQWSPDGRWLVYDNGNQSVYLLNIEQTQQDPTTEPSLLYHSESNLFMLSELEWQPKP